MASNNPKIQPTPGVDANEMRDANDPIYPDTVIDEHGRQHVGNRNPDAITGEPGSHPVGSGLGAAAGGALAGIGLGLLPGRSAQPLAPSSAALLVVLPARTSPKRSTQRLKTLTGAKSIAIAITTTKTLSTTKSNQLISMAGKLAVAFMIARGIKLKMTFVASGRSVRPSVCPVPGKTHSVRFAMPGIVPKHKWLSAVEDRCNWASNFHTPNS